MISAIVLAAGLSTRMGNENKLLLPWKGTTVVAHVVNQLLDAAVDEVIVVLGYEADLVKRTITKNVRIRFVYNEDFEKGMTTSIQKGVATADPNSKGFIICLSDLVLMESSDYNKIADAWQKEFVQDGKTIVLPTYKGKRGNPIVFSAFYKETILQHDKMNGCKAIVQTNTAHLIKLDFNNDHILKDIDTKEAYAMLNKS